MLKYGSSSFAYLSTLVLASVSLTQAAHAHDHEKIRRSGEAYIARAVVDSVPTTFGETCQLPPMGWPASEIVAPGVSFSTFFSAGASSAMTQGTRNGANSEANLTNLLVTVPSSPETTVTALALQVQAHAYCDGDRAIVFGSTQLINGQLNTSPTQAILSTGLVNQQVSVPSGSLTINEQFVFGSYSKKKIIVNGMHFSNSGFDLILGHVEADVDCPDDDFARNLK